MASVVITGLGCCTALGIPASNLTQQLLLRTDQNKNVHSVEIPEDLGGGDNEVMIAVAVWDPSSILGLRRPFPDRPTIMAITATDQALSQAGLVIDRNTANTTGLIVDTCFGPSATVERFLRTLLSKGPAEVSAISFSRAVSNAIGGEISRRHNLRGPSTTVLGSSSLAYAVDLLIEGRADAMLCVGVDEVRDLHLWAYRRAGLLSQGLILGEGAAAVVLERRDAAIARGAHIFASVYGVSMGFCAAAVDRITDFTLESIKGSMQNALQRGTKPTGQVKIVVGAASGHEPLRQAERGAVESLFGGDPPTWLEPKQLFGESFGASECIGLAVGVNTLRPSADLCIVNALKVGGATSSILLGCET